MTDFLRFIDWANRPFEELRVHFNPAVIETITMPCILEFPRIAIKR